MADEREAAAACYKISSIIMMMKLCPVDKQKGFKGMGEGKPLLFVVNVVDSI